ncbi:MAG: hypothetical protein JXO44_03125 [Clostridia bacterium]|nr:hypothetical protein [Clostridia bacterium]
MVNFGFDWLFLVEVDEAHILEYETLLYYHQLPFHTIEEAGRYRIQIPEKYMSIGCDVIAAYQAGNLANPVNDFDPRYSHFERGRKVRQPIRPHSAFKWHFLFLLIIMLFMLLVQMVLYIRK